MRAYAGADMRKLLGLKKLALPPLLSHKSRLETLKLAKTKMP
jgi:hypothetical protein